MKKTKLFFIFTALSFLYFTACNEQSEISAPQRMNFDSPEFVVIDYFDVQNAIEDASLDKDMVFNGTLLNYSFMNMGHGFTPANANLKGNPWFDRFDFNKQLGRVLRVLNLTGEQKTSIRGFMITYHETIKPLIKQFYEANKEIIREANVQRKAIVQDLKDGKITREEAAAKLKELNQKTKEAINTSSETLKVKDKMCQARKTLFDNIASILSVSQLPKWTELIAKIKNPCL